MYNVGKLKGVFQGSFCCSLFIFICEMSLEVDKVKCAHSTCVYEWKCKWPCIYWFKQGFRLSSAG